MTKRRTELAKQNKPWLKSPVIGNNGLNLEPGDNTKFLTLNMTLVNLPNIDLDNAEQVQERLNEYFSLYAEYDMKPTVAGMALSLNGMSRQMLWAIVNNACTGGNGSKPSISKESADAIKRNYRLLENLWENYMNSGKINPVSGIFLGKNNYGYQDKQEMVVTPNAQQDDYNADTIRQKYIKADTTEVDDD